MSQVKISELPEITHLNVDTTQSLALGVDLATGITGKYTLKTLAEGLYSNDVLNVGNNEIIFPNVIAQFVDSANPYLQINLQNTDGNGSSDMVITADTGTDVDGFVDLGINGSNFNQPAYTSMDKLDGYLFAVGPASNSHKGNLVIGTATSNANVVFAVGGTLRQNIVAKFTSTGLVLNNQSSIVFADGTRQTTAGSSVANTILLQGGLNSANANIALIQAVDVYQNTVTSAAFTKANNALANTTGTFAGTLNIANNLTVNGTFILANSNFSATESAMRISANSTVAAPSNDGYMLHISGKNGVPSRIVNDSYGTGAYSLIAGRAARGTTTSPTALQSGDIIARYSGNGYGTTKYQTLGTTRIDFVAAENYTDANTGSQIQFWNCPNGSNTLTNIATFNGTGAIFTGTVEPQKGFIYTPRILPGAQTAITINFTNDAMVRATLTADLTITLSNYVAGKVVEVWLTNTGGTNRTVTHGCSATNSSENATTFTIPGTSSAYIRYFSLAGDLGNTFVTSIHA